jgi:hypothetical protein
MRYLQKENDLHDLERNRIEESCTDEDEETVGRS